MDNGMSSYHSSKNYHGQPASHARSRSGNGSLNAPAPVPPPPGSMTGGDMYHSYRPSPYNLYPSSMPPGSSLGLSQMQNPNFRMLGNKTAESGGSSSSQMLSRKRPMNNEFYSSTYETSVYPEAAFKKPNFGGSGSYSNSNVGYSSEYAKPKDYVSEYAGPGVSHSSGNIPKAMPIIPSSAMSSSAGSGGGGGGYMSSLEKYFTEAEIKKFNEYKRFVMMTSLQGQKKFYNSLTPAEHKRFMDFMDMDNASPAPASYQMNFDQQQQQQHLPPPMQPNRIMKPPLVHHSAPSESSSMLYQSFQYDAPRYFKEESPETSQLKFSSNYGRLIPPPRPVSPSPLPPHAFGYDTAYAANKKKSKQKYTTEFYGFSQSRSRSPSPHYSSSKRSHHRDTISSDRKRKSPPHHSSSKGNHPSSSSGDRHTNDHKIRLPTQDPHYLTKEMNYYMKKYKAKLEEQKAVNGANNEERKKKVVVIAKELGEIKKKILNFRNDLIRLGKFQKGPGVSKSSAPTKSSTQARSSKTLTTAKKVGANKGHDGKSSSRPTATTHGTKKPNVQDGKGQKVTKKPEIKKASNSFTSKSNDAGKSKERTSTKDRPEARKHEGGKQTTTTRSSTPQRKSNFIQPEEFDACVMHYQWCHMCDLFFDSPIQFLTHLHREGHIERMHPSDYSILRRAEFAFNQSLHQRLPDEDPLFRKDDEDEEFGTDFIGSEFLYPSKSYYCDLCTKFLLTLEESKHHLKSEKHVQAYKKYLAKNEDYAKEIMDERRRSMRRSRFIVHQLLYRKSKGENILMPPKVEDPVTRDRERSVRHCVLDMLDFVENELEQELKKKDTTVTKSKAKSSGSSSSSNHNNNNSKSVSAGKSSAAGNNKSSNGKSSTTASHKPTTEKSSTTGKTSTTGSSKPATGKSSTTGSNKVTTGKSSTTDSNKPVTVKGSTTGGTGKDQATSTASASAATKKTIAKASKSNTTGGGAKKETNNQSGGSQTTTKKSSKEISNVKFVKPKPEASKEDIAKLGKIPKKTSNNVNSSQSKSQQPKATTTKTVAENNNKVVVTKKREVPAKSISSSEDDDIEIIEDEDEVVAPNVEHNQNQQEEQQQPKSKVANKVTNAGDHTAAASRASATKAPKVTKKPVVAAVEESPEEETNDGEETEEEVVDDDEQEVVDDEEEEVVDEEGEMVDDDDDDEEEMADDGDEMVDDDEEQEVTDDDDEMVDDEEEIEEEEEEEEMVDDEETDIEQDDQEEEDEGIEYCDDEEEAEEEEEVLADD